MLPTSPNLSNKQSITGSILIRNFLISTQVSKIGIFMYAEIGDNIIRLSSYNIFAITISLKIKTARADFSLCNQNTKSKYENENTPLAAAQKYALCSKQVFN